jgi:hypothetical protein
MAIPYYNPFFDTLLDGGIYDPLTDEPVSNVAPTPTGLDSGLDNPNLVTPGTSTTVKQPTKTITGATTKRDSSNNLVQVITYSDGSTEEKLIELFNPNPVNPPAPGSNTSEDYDTTFRRQSAFEVLKERFQSFGLTSLANEIEKIFKGEGKTRANSPIPIPTSEAGFYLALTETDAYYQRFGKVNEDRIKSGFTALDERTILGMEDEYQKVMKAYGMPKGFYDTPEDFQTFISNDLSELELADRLQASRQFTQVVDPVIKDQLKSMYNIDDNMLTAYISDPEKGQKLLTNLAGRSLTGAAALLSGLTAEAARVAEGLGAGELRFQEQQQRFGAAQTIAERGQFLSQIERADKEFGEKEAVDITFGGLEQSRKAAERLASRERARFGGAAGTTTSSLATPTAGQF